VQQLVQEVLTELLGDAKDIQVYAAAYSKQHGSSSSSSLRQQAAAVEMAALLDPSSKAAGVKQLLAAVSSCRTVFRCISCCCQGH
jgi:hypothetical protein